MKFLKKEQKVTLVCIFLFLFLLSSCTKKNQSTMSVPYQEPVSSFSNPDTVSTSAIHPELALIDIPLPLYDEIIALPFGEQKGVEDLVFAYKTPLSEQEVSKFFLDQMERYGWKHLITFNHAELLMQFESPDRYCTVSVRRSPSNDDSLLLYIFVSQKISL